MDMGSGFGLWGLSIRVPNLATSPPVCGFMPFGMQVTFRVGNAETA